MIQSSFVCIQLNGCLYKECANILVWSSDRTLTDTTPLGHRGPGNNKVLHICQSSWTETSWSDVLVSYSRRLLIEGGLTPMLRGSLRILQPLHDWCTHKHTHTHTHTHTYIYICIYLTPHQTWFDMESVYRGDPCMNKTLTWSLQKLLGHVCIRLVGASDAYRKTQPC